MNNEFKSNSKRDEIEFRPMLHLKSIWTKNAALDPRRFTPQKSHFESHFESRTQSGPGLRHQMDPDRKYGHSLSTLNRKRPLFRELSE